MVDTTDKEEFQDNRDNRVNREPMLRAKTEHGTQQPLRRTINQQDGEITTVSGSHFDFECVLTK